MGSTSKALAVIAIAFAAFYLWTTRDTHRAAARSETTEATAKRLSDWAVIEKTKQLSPTEELSLVVIPSSLGEFFDTKCLVYKNRELNQVKFTCPAASDFPIDDAPDRRN